MAQQMTVKTLIEILTKAVRKSPEVANKYIVISDDNEGNGYHGMFYGITYNPESVKEIIDFSGINDSCYTEPQDIVILG